MKIIRYRTHPHRADENQRLIEAVFRELGDDQLRYAALRATDDTFFHLVESPKSPALQGLPAFEAFQREIRSRCVELPQHLDVVVVGDHRMLRQ